MVSSLSLSLTILLERIQLLDKEDKKDICELFAYIPNVIDDTEELQSIFQAVHEILEQKPGGLFKIDLTQDSGIEKWAEHIGTKIKESRKKANFTQEELAKQSGIPQSHISRLENGKHNPSNFTLEKIAKALNIEFNEKMTEERG